MRARERGESEPPSRPALLCAQGGAACASRCVYAAAAGRRPAAGGVGGAPSVHGGKPSEIQPAIKVGAGCRGDGAADGALIEYRADAAWQGGEGALLGDGQHGGAEVLRLLLVLDAVDAAVVHQRVDDGQHVLVPQVHFGEALGGDEGGYVGQRGVALAVDVAETSFPQGLDELRVKLLLGVPGAARDFSGWLQFEQHVQLFVAACDGFDRLDQLAGLESLQNLCNLRLLQIRLVLEVLRPYSDVASLVDYLVDKHIF
mmetsp:Transcript_2554/g.6462  ORF Transcript_2554/g.6462 Transcript_2554/m.6462 type:complete len:258 (+) Transcript_2554:854-1627(+)